MGLFDGLEQGRVAAKVGHKGKFKMDHTTRSLVNRGKNPFAPIASAYNKALIQDKNQIYEKLTDRVDNRLKANPKEKVAVEAAIQELKARIHAQPEEWAGWQYTQEHFGRLELQPYRLIDINVDIQRLLEIIHQCNIIEKFDPRILQPVNVVYIKSTGRYSAWEGQQSSSVWYLLYQAGLIDPDTLIQCKVVDDDLKVPGSDLVGEGFGNLGFRHINTSRKPIDAFNIHRSRVSGVRNYNSTLLEDVQAEEIQQIFEKNDTFPAPPSASTRDRAEPGMITHIQACNDLAGLGESASTFNIKKEDLNSVLDFHNRYFSNEKGVNGVFIITMGRLYEAARLSHNTKGKLSVTITRETEDDLAQMIVETYGSPKGFHNDCQVRLKTWQKTMGFPISWKDECCLPILILDYQRWKNSKQYPLPIVPLMQTYARI